MSNDKSLHVEFYPLTVEDEAASKKSGRPIFQEIDMIHIKFPGDRKRELHAPATEESYVREARRQLSYIERFPEHYKAYLDGHGDSIIGTPLEGLSLSAARVAELKALNIKTIEMLAGLNDTMIQKIGSGIRSDVESAKSYLSANTNSSEVEALKARIAELEAMSKDTSDHTDEFSDMDDSDIKAAIRAAGGTVPSGMASRSTLVDALRRCGEAA